MRGKHIAQHRHLMACALALMLISGCSLGSKWMGYDESLSGFPDINTVSLEDMCTPPQEAPKIDPHDRVVLASEQDALSKQGAELLTKTFKRDANS